MKIDINGVSITLTQDQLDEIALQTSNRKLTVKDLHYQNACELLKEKQLIKKDFQTEKSFYQHKLETLIKAANFIDNDYKEYTPDFTDSNTRKYIPYLERKKNGWVLDGVDGYYYFSVCPVGFYFKNEDTARIIVNNNIDLYNQVWD